MSSSRIKKMVLAGMFLALGLVLPFLTGQIPEIGKKLSPMHIPVLLCGFICGWQYGLIVGVITPVLRSLMFGMPALFPQAVGMAFELGAYGLSSALLYRFFKQWKVAGIYITLVLSMLIGRIVWGLASVVLYSVGVPEQDFTFQMFLAGGFINAVPGIVLHLILIPVILIGLKRAGVMRGLEED
ncbi:MAG: ECF transporter S component [Lachnospiraceae bacterium]|nr:ECF transporter S component [Lachnospiraceae bacterium]